MAALRSVSFHIFFSVASIASPPPGWDIPRVNVNPDNLTVSGISSGAFMAIQVQTSFSSTIYGVAALAGGPFWCAQDQVALALTSCMKDGSLISVAELALVMTSTAATGFIDPLKHLGRTRLWLLSAQQDTEVELAVVRKAEALYAEFQVDPASQTQAVYDQPGVHAQLIALPVANVSNPCLVFGPPYINACGFDAAGSALQWLYFGRLTPPTTETRTFYGELQEAPGAVHWGLGSQRGALKRANSSRSNSSSTVLRGAAGSLYEFDQTLFVDGKVWSDIFGLAATAFVYIPDVCLVAANQTTPCLIHAALHGCLQTTADVGFDFMLWGGYLPWADANRMVVLFPQAAANALNPKGCWDWWGYTGPAYASNVGTQTLVIRRELDVLLGATPSANRTWHVAPH